VPFTVSHVAAVLPAVGRSDRLPAAALVIGSMTPDYPWFLTHGRTSGLSHSVLGLVTVDLAVGMLAVVLWWRWAQAPVRDLVPRPLGTRLPQARGLAGRRLPDAALAVVVGALTHLVWDSFTHEGRWGVELVPWLRDAQGSRAGYGWAQDASSVVGLAVLGIWAARRLARTPPDPAELRSTPRERLAAGTCVVVCGVVGALAGVVPFPGSLLTAVFGVVAFGGAALLVGLVVVCALWWARVPADADVREERG
jgi:hypothetical protein